MNAKPCTCHADDALYGSLDRCPRCRHRSYDRGVGCERRSCGAVVPDQQTLDLGAMA